MNALLCSSDEMQKYFVFPKALDVSALVQVTCGLNATVLTAEFEQVFSINKLVQEVSLAN